MSEGTAVTFPAVEQLVEEINTAVIEDFKTQIYPQRKRDYMYLSDIHRCPRYNLYSMVEGDKKKPFEPAVVGKLEAGKMWEKEVQRKLLSMRFDFIKAQETVELKSKTGELIARGKIDGVIRYKGQEFPAEIKMVNPYTFNQINSYDDFFKTEWTEKYLRQLLMYMYTKNKEQGLFILGPGNDTKPKPIPVYLDYGYCEGVLQKIEKAFEAKKGGDVPERIPYSPKICGMCGFTHICTPDVIMEGADRIDNEELASMLARHEELKDLKREYDAVHESVQDQFKGKPKTTISGQFIVTPKKRMMMRYDTKLLDQKVRDEIKTQTEAWVIDIERIGGKNG